MNEWHRNANGQRWLLNGTNLFLANGNINDAYEIRMNASQFLRFNLVIRDRLGRVSTPGIAFTHLEDGGLHILPDNYTTIAFTENDAYYLRYHARMITDGIYGKQGDTMDDYPNTFNVAPEDTDVAPQHTLTVQLRNNHTFTVTADNDDHLNAALTVITKRLRDDYRSITLTRTD